MGTLIAVVAITFNSHHFPADSARGPLVQVQAVAQAICQDKHPEGQAQPLRGAIGVQTPGGVEVLPSALFGCFIPPDDATPPKAGPQALRKGA